MNTSTANNTAVYLRPEVKIEPLICRWYAWSHLVAPVQMALHITYRILPLMQSFASNPSVHIAANSDPNMYGGPFMSLKADDVERLKTLIADTTTDCADLITLAQDLRAMDTLLQEKANGFSLNEYYATLPTSLRGLVELLYDVNHHASIRFFEKLVYDMNLAPKAQEIMMYPIKESERDFFMSTPRLDSPSSLSFKMKFSDQRLDALSAMRSEAAEFDRIAELFEIPADRRHFFREFSPRKRRMPAPRRTTAKKAFACGISAMLAYYSKAQRLQCCSTRLSALNNMTMAA